MLRPRDAPRADQYQLGARAVRGRDRRGLHVGEDVHRRLAVVGVHARRDGRAVRRLRRADVGAAHPGEPPKALLPLRLPHTTTHGYHPWKKANKRVIGRRAAHQGSTRPKRHGECGRRIGAHGGPDEPEEPLAAQARRRHGKAALFLHRTAVPSHQKRRADEHGGLSQGHTSWKHASMAAGYTLGGRTS